MKLKTNIQDEDSKSPVFADSVNMQGLQPILDPNSGCLRKCLWVIVVLFALSFTAYNISKQIVHYFSSPITVNMDIRRATELPFPTVTLCNFNLMRKDIASRAHESVPALVKTLKPLAIISVNKTPNYDGIDFSVYHHPGAWEYFYASHGHHVPGSLLQCRWERDECGIQDFGYTFTDFGVCFVFNGDGRLKARNSGREYGLRLSLHAQQHEYLRSFAGHYGAGFKVAIHPHGVPPILSEKGISVSPGFHNSLAVDVSKLKNAHASVSKCGSKPLKYYLNQPYSTQACRQECLREFVVGKCGCRELYMPGNETLVCDPPELFSCVYPTIDEYVKNSDKDCEKTCPDPCSTFIYKTIPSAAPLSDTFLAEYSDYVGGNESYWRKNFVEVEIYLTSMSYQYIEKRLAYTLLDLLCDIGGALGLLLGASFLTILEVVDFLVLRPKNRKVNEHVHNNQIKVRPADHRF